MHMISTIIEASEQSVEEMLDYFRNLIAQFRARLRKEPEPRRMRLITKTKVATAQPVGSSDLSEFIYRQQPAQLAVWQ